MHVSKQKNSWSLSFSWEKNLRKLITSSCVTDFHLSFCFQNAHGGISPAPRLAEIQHDQLTEQQRRHDIDIRDIRRDYDRRISRLEREVNRLKRDNRRLRRRHKKDKSRIWNLLSNITGKHKLIRGPQFFELCILGLRRVLRSGVLPAGFRLRNDIHVVMVRTIKSLVGAVEADAAH